jgi:hypothetical protein
MACPPVVSAGTIALTVNFDHFGGSAYRREDDGRDEE